jgi:glycosyltransferase involved in cell wall biosynthesis
MATQLRSPLPPANPLVVIPTYNERPTIISVLRQVRDAAPGVTVLVVDDSSPDGTANLVEDTARQLGRIHVLRRPAKAGLGSAYRDGFDWGLAHGFGVLVEMDADLSHDPHELRRLLAAIDAGADLAVGSRYVPGASIPEWSKRRRLLSRLGNRYASYALRLHVCDATSGYRAFRADTIRRIDFGTTRAEGYGFQIETAWRVSSAGGSVVEVPITFVDRTQGQSKMSVRIVLEALALVTWWGLCQRLSLRPARPGMHDDVAWTARAAA